MEKVNPALEKFQNFTEKGKKKISQICKVAAQVISEKSYLGSTLSDISRAAGTSKGGIFHYFSTKEELLFFILYSFMNQTVREIRRKINSNNTPLENVRIFIHHHIGDAENNLAETSLLLRESRNLPPKYLKIIKDLEREYVNILRGLVVALMKRHRKNTRKVTFITYSLLGMCNWPIMWFNPNHKSKSNSSELAKQIYEIFVGDLQIP